MRLVSKAAFISGFFLFLFIFGCVQQTTPESESQSCIGNLDKGCSNNLDPVCGLNGRTYTNCCYAQMDNATIAKLSACDALGCNDNDTGYNLDLAGTVETIAENKTDYCIDSSTLNEYECRYGQIFNSLVPCPSGWCEDGKCLRCVDTDYGPDIFTPGEIRYYYGPSNYMLFKDECKQAGYLASLNACTEFYNDSSSLAGYGDRSVNCTQSDLLVEYTCKYDYIFTYYVSCPPGSGCLNGKCVYG